MRPYVAKSYFETYKSNDHMQKIRPISKNFNKMLAFENLEKMRLTYENRHNALNFEIEGSSSGFSHFFVCSTNAILQLRLYDQFEKKSFFSTPLRGGLG